MLGRSVRTTQPQGPARIDWSNPITRGLVTAFNSASGTSVTSDGAAITPSGNLLRRLSRSGVGYGNATNGDSGVIVLPATDRNRLVGSNGTIFHVTDWNASLTTAEAIWAVRDSGTQVSQLGYAGNSVNLILNNTNFSVTITPSNYQNQAARLTNAAVVDYFGNGALVGSIATTQSFLTSTIAPSLFNRIGGARAHTGNTPLVATWNRALSDAEIKSLSDNPWQIFAPDSKALWTPAETISGAGSSITAASGSSITSTATGQAQAASTQAATTGTSTTSTLTGSAVVSATITAANGTSTTGTLAAGGSSAATTTPAGGTSTASTMVGSSTSGANVADGPPIGGFVAIGQLGPASPVASGSTIAPASGSSIAETLTSSISASATISSAAGTSVTSTMVGASTSGTAATMTAAGGTSTTSTMTSAAISSAAMLVNSSSSITSTMVGFPPTENNADTHDGYFHKLWAKLAKKPEYQLEILEERLEEIAEEIEQVKAITRPVIYQSAPIPQNNPFDAQAKLLQALIVESARIRRDIEDEEEAEMLLML